MPLENIINRILKDADAKTSAFKRDASKKADEILKKAESEARALEARMLEEANLRARLEIERSCIAKNLDIKKEILKEKKGFIDRAFDEALKHIEDLDEEKYLGILETAILGQLKDKTEYEIQLSKKDAPRINRDFVENLNKKGLRLKLGEYRDTEDLGFMLKKDRFIIDFSFSKELKALRERIEFEVAKILFS